MYSKLFMHVASTDCSCCDVRSTTARGKAACRPDLLGGSGTRVGRGGQVQPQLSLVYYCQPDLELARYYCQPIAKSAQRHGPGKHHHLKTHESPGPAAHGERGQGRGSACQAVIERAKSNPTRQSSIEDERPEDGSSQRRHSAH